MKQETKLKIRGEAWQYTWEKYKSEYTMETIAKEVFNIPLTTFYRGVVSKGRKENNK